MWSDARRRRIGSDIEAVTIQKTGVSRCLLDSLDHRGKKVSIQCGTVHETAYVGFRHYDHVDFRYRTWMMKRQYTIIFVDTIHVELT